MKEKIHQLKLISFFLCLVPFFIHSIVYKAIGSELKPDDIKKDLAMSAVLNMNSGHFDDVVALFNKKMANALPSKKLQNVWKQLVSQFGSYHSVIDISKKEEGSNTTVFLATRFGSSLLDVKVSFDNNNNIIGLFFAPSIYRKPTSKSALTETEVKFGDADWLLNGRIHYPSTGNSFPLVILVHGSGPHDMDLTIGPNKPFLNISEGLAEYGIATLRYNKRTYEHAEKFSSNSFLLSNLTIDNEIVDDVVHAFRFSRNLSNINPKKIFIAGLSQGGALVPRIAKFTPEAAGYIMLSTPARDIEVLLMEQLSYIAELDGNISKEELRSLKAMKAKVLALNSLGINNQISAKDLPLGLSRKYWLSLKEYKAVDEAKLIRQPLFIGQGGRDYQVLQSKDFKLWQDTFNENENVTLMDFPNLNHLMIAGHSNSTPQEYFIKTEVDKEFISDLAEWVNINK